MLNFGSYFQNDLQTCFDLDISIYTYLDMQALQD